MPARRTRKPNIVLFGIDSLRRDHMSCYGYPRLTTPHIDRFAAGRHALRADLQRPHPHDQRLRLHADRAWTSSRTQVVALRHKGPLRPEVHDAARDPARGGLQHHLRRLQRQPRLARLRHVPRLPRLGQLERRPQPQGPEPQRRRHPRAGPAGAQARALLPLPAPHGPALALPAAGALRAHVLPRQRVRPSATSPWSRSWPSSPSATSSPAGCRRASPTRTTSSPSTTARSPTWTPASRRIFTALEALRHLAENTIVVINSDHGETLYDHECWFDHHGMYEPTLRRAADHPLPGQGAGRRARARATTSTRTWCRRCWTWPASITPTSSFDGR